MRLLRKFFARQSVFQPWDKSADEKTIHRIAAPNQHHHLFFLSSFMKEGTRKKRTHR